MNTTSIQETKVDKLFKAFVYLCLTLALIAVLYPMYGIVNLFLVTAVLLYPFRNRYKSS